MKYMKNILKNSAKESVSSATERTILSIQKWAEEINADWTKFFEEVSYQEQYI